MGVASGFSQLPRKCPLQEMEGPLQEDDSSLLESTVFRAGSGPVRDLPGVAAGASEMNQTALREFLESPPQLSLLLPSLSLFLSSLPLYIFNNII